MNYLAYQFIVNPPAPGSEILMAVISEMGFESFDATETGFNAYIQQELNDAVHLDEILFDDFTYSYSIQKIEHTNWNSEWEKNFEPVTIKNILNIRAPFHQKNNLVKHEIIIMPKMSFGTGHHQTTRLVCEQMFETDFKHKRILDMGCGTGILSIWAHKLGASDILGIDIDEWSVENAKENCDSNNCSTIEIKKGDVEDLENENAFDIVLANINKNILKKQIPHYSPKIVHDGKLFLSGFFTTDVEELKTLAEMNGFKFISTHNENEWAVMCLQKII